MNGVIRYAAVNTKIRALESKLLTDSEYRALLGRTSLSELVDFLKQTSYVEVLGKVDSQTIHRGDLEILMKRYAMDVLMKLTHYFHGGYRKFIEILLMRYEVEDLKVLIRAVYTDRDPLNMGHLAYIGRYGTLNLEALAASRSFTDLVENLKGTPYYPYLSSLALKDNQEDQFRIEMALDASYISIYKRNLKLLSREEQRLVYRIQGMRTDLLNLQWIYRGLKFYRLPPEVLLNYTIHFGGRLTYQTIRDLCYSTTIQTLEEKMLDSRYRFLFTHEHTKDIFMERRIYRYQYHKLKGFKRMSGMDIVHTIVFFQLLEYEIRDIISIIENIRYHNEDQDQVKRCLIRSI